MKHSKIKIYKAYIRAKATGRSITELAAELGMTRSNLYHHVAKIALGEVWKMNECMAQSRLSCVWEYKYKTRYSLIPKNRLLASIDELQNLIKDMSEDGFTQVQIARFLKKDRTTILHHINKWKTSQ